MIKPIKPIAPKYYNYQRLTLGLIKPIWTDEICILTTLKS